MGSNWSSSFSSDDWSGKWDNIDTRLAPPLDKCGQRAKYVYGRAGDHVFPIANSRIAARCFVAKEEEECKPPCTSNEPMGFQKIFCNQFVDQGACLQQQWCQWRGATQEPRALNDEEVLFI